MKPSRLRGRKTSELLLRKGSLWKGKTMMIRWTKGHPKNLEKIPAKPCVYVGSAVSAKVDKSAVRRNRMRRRCREAVRTHLADAENLPTLQLLILPRSGSLTCGFQDIKTDVATFFSSVA